MLKQISLEEIQPGDLINFGLRRDLYRKVMDINPDNTYRVAVHERDWEFYGDFSLEELHEFDWTAWREVEDVDMEI